MHRLTKAEQDALRYLKSVETVWTKTAADDFFSLLVRLEKKGFVKFLRRPDQTLDAVCAEKEPT